MTEVTLVLAAGMHLLLTNHLFTPGPAPAVRRAYARPWPRKLRETCGDRCFCLVNAGEASRRGCGNASPRQSSPR